MSNIRQFISEYNQVGTDAAGRSRVSQITTVFDGKVVNGHNSLIFDETGSGQFISGSNKITMTASGSGNEYTIFQSNRDFVYLSGKSQLVEETFDTFSTQSGVIKRVGYFDSNDADPTANSSSYDGFWLETTDDSIKLVVQNEDDGEPNHEVDITEWTGYESLGEYQNISTWDYFTVIIWDFLWLGGAVLRLWLKTDNGFKLAHIYNYSGKRKDTMIKWPCKPIRYEVRNVGGNTNGEFRYICSQVATEGSINNMGIARSVDTGITPITLTTTGTTYPILAIRKNSPYRCIPAELLDFTTFITTNNDYAKFTIQYNPTLSAPLTYTDVDKSSVQKSIGDGIITVTADGDVLASGYYKQDTILPTKLLDENFLTFLTSGVNFENTGQYVLCITPISNNIDVFGEMSYKEY